jgi:polyferredoxin
MILIIAAIMLYALLTRAVLNVSALHDRSPLYTTLSDGSVRNAYTLKISNKLYSERTLTLTVDGMPGADVSRVGGEDGLPVFAVGPDAVLSFRVFVTSRDAGDIASQGIEFVLTDKESGTVARTDSNFRGPKR